jgi:serine/threonine protein kinase
MEENKTYAIKILRDNQINTIQKIENFMKEIQLLSEIRHENVIELKSVNLNGKYSKYNGRSWKVAYYVMSFAEYGEFYSFLQFTPSFNENLARYYFHQLITGIFS